MRTKHALIFPKQIAQPHTLAWKWVLKVEWRPTGANARPLPAQPVVSEHPRHGSLFLSYFYCEIMRWIVKALWEWVVGFNARSAAITKILVAALKGNAPATFPLFQNMRRARTSIYVYLHARCKNIEPWPAMTKPNVRPTHTTISLIVLERRLRTNISSAK